MKISVLVAAYNVEKYISDCLKSLCEQTLNDSEFIIIDDGSTDSTKNICDNFQLLDPRLKVFHQRNRGLLNARKVAVSYSKGDYILFLDGDDLLAYPDALKDIYRKAISSRVDILRFDVSVISSDGKVDQEKNNFWGRKGRAKNDPYEIIKQCFFDQACPWNLWLNLYKGDIVRKAYSYVVDERFIVTEDVYGHFLISYFSTSYLPVSTNAIYIYRSSTGITGSRKMLFPSFKEHGRQSICIMWIRDFLQRMGDLERYDIILDTLEFRLLEWEFQALMSVDLSYRNQAFSFLASLPNVDVKLRYLFSHANFLNTNNGSISKFNFFKYLKYRILSKITFGNTRKRYKEKYRKQKNLIIT